MANRRYNMIGKSKHINLSKAIAAKYDLGIVVDYYLDEIVVSGNREDIELFENDLIRALQVHLMG